MRNFCGRLVVMLGIVWGYVVALYAVVDKTTVSSVYIRGLYTLQSSSFYQGFTTTKNHISPLLNFQLYPLSTVPIKTSTK
jgi:hypothetical protein